MTTDIREIVFQTLFNIGAALTWTDPSNGDAPMTWSFTSRKIKTFAMTPIQPAFYQVEPDESLIQATNTPGKQTLSAIWVMMHRFAEDPAKIATQLNNQIVDAALTSLLPLGGDSLASRNTLGGLAYHVWVKGQVIKDSGDMDGQGLVLVPISILLPT